MGRASGRVPGSWRLRATFVGILSSRTGRRPLPGGSGWRSAAVRSRGRNRGVPGTLPENARPRHGRRVSGRVLAAGTGWRTQWAAEAASARRRQGGSAAPAAVIGRSGTGRRPRTRISGLINRSVACRSSRSAVQISSAHSAAGAGRSLKARPDRNRLVSRSVWRRSSRRRRRGPGLPLRARPLQERIDALLEQLTVGLPDDPPSSEAVSPAGSPSVRRRRPFSRGPMSWGSVPSKRRQGSGAAGRPCRPVGRIGRDVAERIGRGAEAVRFQQSAPTACPEAARAGPGGAGRHDGAMTTNARPLSCGSGVG